MEINREAKLARRRHYLLTKGGELTTSEQTWLLYIEKELGVKIS